MERFGKSRGEGGGAAIAIFFLISLSASIIGAVCGIGGGVIIKPLLDLFDLVDVARANFLSGSTVLAMSAYSVLKSFHDREGSINLATSTSLAAGALAGGFWGKSLFSAALREFPSESVVGNIQSILLLLLTVFTLAYTLCKSRILRLNIENKAAVIAIGVLLGAISSFLGIGGGPLNLIVFSYFFSMDTKTAARNSLYVILLSQLANTVSLVTTREIPAGDFTPLILMISGGLAGAFIGTGASSRFGNRGTEILFVILQVCIIAICVVNVWRFSAG